MNIEWQHHPNAKSNVKGTTDCWQTRVNPNPRTGEIGWALYKRGDGRWHLYYWRFRGESWDTLEEAKAVSTALYRMGHFDGWKRSN